MVLRRPWWRPLLMGQLALFAATPGMVAGCCYVIDVTVDSIGIVLERTDARPLGAPGSARARATTLIKTPANGRDGPEPWLGCTYPPFFNPPPVHWW
jgi:hypothetical protein